MSRALVIGHSGQDGRILWDQLVVRGFSLVGISRSGIRTHDADHIPIADIENAAQLQALVDAFTPTQVYYLAAHHHSSQDAGINAAEIWERSWAVHVRGFGNVLQALAASAPQCRAFYAASSRVFGSSHASPVDEDTPRLPDDSYGVTKAAGMQLADYYRRMHGLFVSCGILFNHESPLRGSQFVTQRVVRGLVAIARGDATRLEVGSLDAHVDWGYAPDFTRAMQNMLDAPSPGDFIVATGMMHSVRELVEIAAAYLGLDWRAVVVETGGLLRRTPQGLCGNASRLREVTGWEPSVDFVEIVQRLVDAALVYPAVSQGEGRSTSGSTKT